MKCSPGSPPDITTDREWLEEQQNRLLGFEILSQALRGEQGAITLTEIREKMVLKQLDPDKIYRRRFIPLLLNKLGATNFDEALLVIQRIRDEVR